MSVPLADKPSLWNLAGHVLGNSSRGLRMRQENIMLVEHPAIGSYKCSSGLLAVWGITLRLDNKWLRPMKTGYTMHACVRTPCWNVPTGLSRLRVPLELVMGLFSALRLKNIIQTLPRTCNRLLRLKTLGSTLHTSTEKTCRQPLKLSRILNCCMHLGRNIARVVLASFSNTRSCPVIMLCVITPFSAVIDRDWSWSAVKVVTW